MNILLDPNVAYLVLLGGILLSLLALATPGTGALELGAIFCFLLAGYAAYTLSIHWWALMILLSSLIPFFFAIRGRNKIFLAASILLMMTGATFLFAREGEWMSVHPLVALISSGLTAVFIWFVGVKFLETIAARPAHDLDALIGQTGEARSDIDKDGSIQVGGELWSARCEHKISKGSAVRVLRRDGFILIVEKEA
ncbi:MAG: hypothetical protein Fur002_19420 [Anaerolineales bacterium]